MNILLRSSQDQISHQFRPGEAWVNLNLNKPLEQNPVTTNKFNANIFSSMLMLSTWSKYLRRAWAPGPNLTLGRNVNSDRAPVPGVLRGKLANSGKILWPFGWFETMCNVTLPSKGLNVCSLLPLASFFPMIKINFTWTLTGHKRELTLAFVVNEK